MPLHFEVTPCTLSHRVPHIHVPDRPSSITISIDGLSAEHAVELIYYRFRAEKPLGFEPATVMPDGTSAIFVRLTSDPYSTWFIPRT
ncbi:MAG: hypothetical protein ACK5U7_11390 [Bacteroidota bacterium]|jgi:hypothetical protein